MFNRSLGLTGRLVAAAVLVGAVTGVIALARTEGPRPLHAAQAVKAQQPAQSVAPLSISAHEYGYDAPDSVPAGVVSFEFTNAGTEYHMAQFLKLNDGVTPDQVVSAAQNGTEVDALALGTTAGGVNATDAGDSETLTLDLAPGNYVMVCFLYGDDNVPHIMKGMMHPFSVDAPPTTAQAPQPDVTVSAQDFGYSIPTLSAGTQTIQFTNNGSQAHEMALVKVTGNDTPDQTAAAAQSPEETQSYENEEEGGTSAIQPGSSVWVTANLTPGLWLFICYMPDPATGLSHANLGMSQLVLIPDPASSPP